jgi:hypothetical protein
MKKTINGKTYNTETARELACWTNTIHSRNFDHYTETLYQRRDGSLFIHGIGGPDSKYAVRVGNGYSGGQDLRPVSKAEAIASVREYANTSEIPSILEEIEGTEAVNE